MRPWANVKVPQVFVCSREPCLSTKKLGSGNQNKHLCSDTENSRVDRRAADCLLRLAGTEGEYGFPLTIGSLHGGGPVERLLLQIPVFLA